MLEETGLPYEPHVVRFDANEQTTPEFLSLSPNNKIPAILDPDGPGGKPLGAVRVGRDPDLPRRQVGPVHAGRSGRAATRRSSG